MGGTRRRLPLAGPVVFGILATAIVFILVFWTVRTTHRDFVQSVSRDQHLVRLSGQIVHLDEVLTMSARMAAATGDPSWEARYHRHEPILDRAIKSATKAAAELFEADAAARTDAANLALVEMELRAFEQVRQGRAPKAAELLTSPAYNTQKGIYASGIGELSDAVRLRSERGVAEAQGRLTLAASLGTLALLALLAAWIVVFVLFRRDALNRLRMERALHEQTRAEEVRTRFVHDVLTAQEDERRRISRELHDALGQSLTSMLFGLRALDEYLGPEGTDASRQLRDLVSNTLDEMNRLARGLHPSVLDDLGFGPAIERLCADFARTHRVTIDLQFTGLQDRFSREVETSLYRIIQEALNNIAKHASAKTVSVIVEHRVDSVRTIVEDDGVGFEPERLREEEGLGLQGIRERASLVKGDLVVESSPGRGSSLFVTIPISTAA